MKNKMIVSVVALCFSGVASVKTETLVSDFPSSGLPPETWEAGGDGSFVRATPNPLLEIAVTASGGPVNVFAGVSADEPVQIGFLRPPATNAVFRLPSSADCKYVALQPENNAVLQTCALEWIDTRIDPPANVTVSEVTRSSFAVSWDAVSDARKYSVELTTNVLVDVSEGVEKLNEHFSNFTPALPKNQSNGLSRETLIGALDTSGAWDGEYLFPETNSVRIGSSTHPGCLVTPPLEFGGDNLSLHFTAWRYDSPAAADYVVERISNNTTSVLEVVHLTGVSNVVITLPPWTPGDRLAFHSSTVKSAYRLVLENITILDGYSAGHHESVLVDVREVTDTSCQWDGLPSVPMQVSVTALAANPKDNSVAVSQAVPLDNPPITHLLNACPLNGDVYVQNFDYLTNITETAWYNGLTVPYWQIFRNRNPAESIKQNGGKTTSGGLYTFHGTDAASYSLGTLATGDYEFTFGLAFQNTAGQQQTITNIVVEFDAVQWSAKTGIKTIPFEYLVTNELVSVVTDGAWQEAVCDPPIETKVNVTVPYTTPVRAVIPTTVEIPFNEYLIIRWYDEKKSSSCAFAIDNVHVTYGLKDAAFIMFLR